MGVEFLNYQSPTGGRDRTFPQWSDLCDRKLLLRADNIQDLHQRLQPHRARNSCSDLLALENALFGASYGFTVRDPDAHGLIIVGDS